MSPEKLGQHFLNDEHWLDQIEDALRPQGGVWIEIGAGHGEMTTRLAQHARKVFAIELDPQLAGRLRKNVAPHGNVEVIQGDVLAVDFANIAAGQKISVYGSLPYYITSPILHRLFQHVDRIEAIHIVIQYEVAARIVATPGHRDFGYLSVASQWFATPEMRFQIPPGAFSPPPKVDSALVSLRMPGARAKITVDDESAFLDFVKECFAHKRKTLRNNLRARLGPRTEEILLRAGLLGSARAEALTVAQFAAMFHLVRHLQQDEKV